MAHVKGAGVTKGNRDSIAKRLGIKRYAGEKVTTGHILVRQRGTRYHAGIGTKLAGDNTIFAARDGVVRFVLKKGAKLITVAA